MKETYCEYCGVLISICLMCDDYNECDICLKCICDVCWDKFYVSENKS